MERGYCEGEVLKKERAIAHSVPFSKVWILKKKKTRKKGSLLWRAPQKYNKDREITINEKLYVNRKVKIIMEFVYDKGVIVKQFQNLSVREPDYNELYNYTLIHNIKNEESLKFSNLLCNTTCIYLLYRYNKDVVFYYGIYIVYQLVFELCYYYSKKFKYSQINSKFDKK